MNSALILLKKYLFFLKSNFMEIIYVKRIYRFNLTFHVQRDKYTPNDDINSSSLS